MIKVFIIDDSMLIRNIVHKILKNNKKMQIIGEASNPIDAMHLFKETGLPDVFILDIEMPKMNGITFLRKLEKERPVPTVIFSSIVNEGSSELMEAFHHGACDVILKPLKLNDSLSSDFVLDFVSKVKAAALSKHIPSFDITSKEYNPHSINSSKVIVIGASTVEFKQ